MRQNGIWLMFSDPSKQVPCSTWLGGGFKPFFFFKLSPPKNWGIWCFSHFDVQNVRMVGSTTTQIMYTKGQKGEKMFTVGHDLCLLHLVIRYGRGLHVTQQYTPHIHIHIYIYIHTPLVDKWCEGLADGNNINSLFCWGPRHMIQQRPIIHFLQPGSTQSDFLKISWFFDSAGKGMVETALTFLPS